jgi:MerR family transcriptional regulator, repressor of the yfmOP operon
MTYFKIDDVARETGLTKRTIRYYEEIGLIQPPDRTDGGTRLYTQEEINKLKRVVIAKDVLGFSLQELQYFISLNESIEQKRNEYRASQDENKLQELKELSLNVHKQIELINMKMEKMQIFKKELEDLYTRANNVLNKGGNKKHSY